MGLRQPKICLIIWFWLQTPWRVSLSYQTILCGTVCSLSSLACLLACMPTCNTCASSVKTLPNNMIWKNISYFTCSHRNIKLFLFKFHTDALACIGLNFNCGHRYWALGDRKGFSTFTFLINTASNVFHLFDRSDFSNIIVIKQSKWWTIVSQK